MIISQQIGKGFYDKATITPYDYFHCYINIPDTCERDSLFQAEARRCKEILTIIEQNPGKKHLCVFDELFSGTNPYEAVASATGYLTYLNKDNNVKYLLTTHYLDLCSKFIPSKEVINYTLDSPYHLQKGISTIKGGIKVLEQLEFPPEIITTAKHIVTLN
jgi:DNA mismatch repair ATPase MutS